MCFGLPSVVRRVFFAFGECHKGLSHSHGGGGCAAAAAAADSGAALEELERLRASGAVEAVEEDQWLYLEDSDKADPGLVLSADAFHSIQAEAALSAEAIPNDTGYKFQWNLQSLGLSGGSRAPMGAPGAWDVTTGSRAVKVMEGAMLLLLPILLLLRISSDAEGSRTAWVVG